MLPSGSTAARDARPKAVLRQVVRDAFIAVFLAEFGDKSMFSTAALATAQNPFGVLLGSLLAHLCATTCAVTGGFFLHAHISERVANYASAFLFGVMGALTGLEGLAQQGVAAAGFLVDKAVTALGLAAADGLSSGRGQLGRSFRGSD
eukprot:Polyplicarium_translucidae@DN2950_c1_g1_i4.p2